MQLELHISSLPEGEKKVIFIDELPWMDTPKSKFIMAVEQFWNGFAAMRNDILLVVCGSATSWIINKIINSHGGLYNRVTMQMYLRPFTLKECELYMKSRGMGMARRDLITGYMVFGGIPYYWSLLAKGQSMTQNINTLCYKRGGGLSIEFERLYSSLFRRPEPYLGIIASLSGKKAGLNREEIARATKIGQGGKLTKYLQELEQCDFIRKYTAFGKKKKETVYQLIDSFTLFYYHFMKDGATDPEYWIKIQNEPKFNTWSGLAFERVCFLHSDQIIKKIGISALINTICSWYQPNSLSSGNTDKKKTPGVQIDMLIDRGDRQIALCEMKYYKTRHSLTQKEEDEIAGRLEAFENAINHERTVRVVMITTHGIVPNEHSSLIDSEVTMDDLFD